MQLSKKAIKDLRLTLDKCIVEYFSDRFTDEELNNLGLLFLVSISECLKRKVKRKRFRENICDKN